MVFKIRRYEHCCGRYLGCFMFTWIGCQNLATFVKLCETCNPDERWIHDPEDYAFDFQEWRWRWVALCSCFCYFPILFACAVFMLLFGMLLDVFVFLGWLLTFGLCCKYCPPNCYYRNRVNHSLNSTREPVEVRDPVMLGSGSHRRQHGYDLEYGPKHSCCPCPCFLVLCPCYEDLDTSEATINSTDTTPSIVRIS